MNYKTFFYIFLFIFFINSSIAQISNNVKNAGIFNNQDYKYLLNLFYKFSLGFVCHQS